MARTVRDTNLSTRSARLRLTPRTKPYWRLIEQGLHLGYRRRATGGSWIARRRDARGTYREEKLGLADDLQDSNGQGILDFAQSQRAARAWSALQERREAGLPTAESGPYTVARALADYLEDFKRRGARGARAVESAVRCNVLPSLGHRLASKLTTRQLLDWHRDLAERPRLRPGRQGAEPILSELDRNDPEAVRRRRASANRVLTYLKAALNFAWRNGNVPSDDTWRRVKPFKAVSAPVIRYLSDDEITRLLNSCEGAFRDLVHAALLTGCRYGELCRLRIKDFNRDVGTLTIRLTKSGAVRHVTLSAEAAELFEQLIAGRAGNDLVLRHGDAGAWKASEQARGMAEACKRAGIEPAISFHVLRHTHASILAMRAVPMAVIARQLGHADTRMTEKHYAHLAPNYVAETIRANFPRLTPSSKSPIIPIRRARIE